jgi:hypothetical protein
VTAQETVRHTLGVAVRLDDHFIGEPIAEELDVRLDTFVLPTQVRGGNSRRHSDGTYRFIDLAAGPHQVEVTSPDARWMTLDPLPVVVTPMLQPSPPLSIAVWPTPLQSTPLGLTAVRGKLVGTPGATIARRVEFDVNGVDTGHHTQSSSFAEFLFLFPGRLDLDADSLVPLSLRVVGGVVSGGDVIHGEQHEPFTGAAFRVVPGRETRVRFHVT